MPKGKKKTKKKEESVGDLDDVVAAAQSGTSLSGIVDDARVKALVKAAAKGRAKDVEALYIVATRLNRDSEARFADGDETLSKKHFDHAVYLFQAAQSFGHLGAIVADVLTLKASIVGVRVTVTLHHCAALATSSAA